MVKKLIIEKEIKKEIDQIDKKFQQQVLDWETAILLFNERRNLIKSLFYLNTK